jgi:hypothetical protein
MMRVDHQLTVIFNQETLILVEKCLDRSLQFDLLFDEVLDVEVLFEQGIGPPVGLRLLGASAPEEEGYFEGHTVIKLSKSGLITRVGVVLDEDQVLRDSVDH